jgi:hypothetical protein
MHLILSSDIPFLIADPSISQHHFISCIENELLKIKEGQYDLRVLSDEKSQ